MSTPIPTPRGFPVIGNVLDVNPEHPNESLAQLFKLHGPIIRLYLPGERIFASSYDIAKDLFNEDKFQKAVTGPLFHIRHATKDGLFTAFSDEPNWALAHRLLMPAFGPLSIKSMFPEMQDIVEQMVLRWARFGPDARIDAAGDFTKLTLDSIAICAMGSRFNSFYSDATPPFVQSMVAVLAEAGARSRRLPLPSAFYTSADKTFDQNIEHLVRISQELIDARRKHPKEKKDLLNAMLHGKDAKTGEQLSDDNIIRNAITFMIAGHETTSGLLSFLMYELLSNPKAYADAQAEVDKVIGKERITVDHMGKFPFIEACLRETLRLHPTAPAFTVSAKGDQVVGGKYEINDKQPVVISLMGLHRDKSVYGEDAEDFRPERMLDEKFKSLPPNSWKPFGNGMRACIGRPFAWQEAILATATLLQTFHITKADPAYKLEIATTLTIKPHDFFIRARLRDEDFLDTVGLSTHKASRDETHGKAARPTQAVDQKDLKPMTVLYGSNTGTCEALANAMSASAPLRGYKAEVKSMDEGFSNVKKDQPLVVITGSYEGQPPDNAGHFTEWLSRDPKESIEGVKYAVFGVGNKEWYTTYQRIPTVVDEGLARNGGIRLSERVAQDVTEGNVFDALDSWADAKLWPSLGAEKNEGSTEQEFRVQIDAQKRSTALRQDMLLGKVLETRLLTTKEGAMRKRHIRIQLPSGTTYKSGDYMAVLPLNPPEQVRRAMRRFQIPWDAVMTIDPSTITSLPKGQAISISDVLSSLVELNQPVTAKTVTSLAGSLADKAQVQELEALSKDSERLKTTSLLDLLDHYPDAHFSFGAFLGALPAMRVRQYSISSSPTEDAQSATLTWSVLDAPAKGEFRPKGHNFLGVCSTYLESLQPGDRVQIGLRPSRVGFNVPDDNTTPMIMACAGTGLAPFRAFVAERAAHKAAGADVGPAMLFYGLNAPDEDDMYRAEFDAWQTDGVVDVRRAFTHAADQSGGCKYVQERIWHDRQDVLEMFRKGAALYLCGAGVVGAGVEGVLAKIRTEVTGEDEQTAKAWVGQLKGERYWADVFA